jgi:hypothetical protein
VTKRSVGRSEVCGSSWCRRGDELPLYEYILVKTIKKMKYKTYLGPNDARLGSLPLTKPSGFSPSRRGVALSLPSS